MPVMPTSCTEDDGYANPHDEVDLLGRFYSSEMTAKTMPYIQQLPFAEWLERQQIGKGVRGGCE